MSRAPRPAGDAPRSITASQTLAASLGANEQLDAVLARVAGAADEHVGRAGDGQRRGAEALRQLAVGELRDDAAGLGTLDGEHREVVRRGRAA